MALQRAPTTPTIETTKAAQIMIRRRQLGGIVEVVLESIQELIDQGMPVLKIDIERDDDPEIPRYTHLVITAWLDPDVVDEGLEYDKALTAGVDRRMTQGDPKELEKYRKWVLAGIDFE